MAPGVTTDPFDPDQLVRRLEAAWQDKSRIRKKTFLRAALHLVEGEAARARHGEDESFNRLWIRMMLELRVAEDQHHWFCVLAEELKNYRDTLAPRTGRWLEIYYTKLKKLHGALE